MLFTYDSRVDLLEEINNEVFGCDGECSASEHSGEYEGQPHPDLCRPPLPRLKQYKNIHL